MSIFDEFHEEVKSSETYKLLTQLEATEAKLAEIGKETLKMLDEVRNVLSFYAQIDNYESFTDETTGITYTCADKGQFAREFLEKYRKDGE